MEVWLQRVIQGFLSSVFILMPQVAVGQSTTPQAETPATPPQEAVSEGLEEAVPEILEEVLPVMPPERNEPAWTWSSLPEGTHLLSSAADPDAESEIFAFVHKQAERIWGLRFMTYPESVPTCFQGEIVAENRAVRALSAVEVNPQEWYFNNAPLDFSDLPYLLETLPADWIDEQVTEQISECEARLASIQIDPDRTLVLGVQSTLPLEGRTQNLQDGSLFNEHEFNGQKDQSVQILMTSSAFDTYLLLLDGDGTTVETNDDFEGDRNAQINTRLPAAGRYRVIANTYDFEGRGDYTLTITTD